MHRWKEEPLYVDRGQVALVDPNDGEPCSAKWTLNDSRTDYIRVSERTGFVIPVPMQAYVTYEYISPKDYIGLFVKVFISMKWNNISFSILYNGFVYYAIVVLGKL